MTTDPWNDTQLDPAIRPRAAAEPGPPRHVLLTGATGFLGAYLLHELLTQTEADVTCLVRAGDPDAALERVVGNLRQAGLWDDGNAGRVAAVAGNLAHPLLGLSADGFGDLAESVDTIFHNGSKVNWKLPYEALRGANVAGTAEILRLACESRTKPVHFISSVASLAPIVKRGLLPEQRELEPWRNVAPGYDTGYTRSKWASEMLVAEARRRGLPVSVHRPAFISGDSRTGYWTQGDFLRALLIGCRQLGMAPDMDYPYNFTPVDWVARTVVEIALRPEALGGVFHPVARPEVPSPETFWSWVEETAGPLRMVPYSRWLETLSNAVEREGNALGPILGYFPKRFDALPPRWRIANEKTRQMLGGTFDEGPAPQELLRTYLERIERDRAAEETK